MATTQELAIKVKLDTTDIDKAIEKLQALKDSCEPEVKDVGPITVTDPVEGRVYDPSTHVPVGMVNVFLMKPSISEGFIDCGQWKEYKGVRETSPTDVFAPTYWCKIPSFIDGKLVA